MLDNCHSAGRRDMVVSVARLVGIIRLTDAANLGELWNASPVHRFVATAELSVDPLAGTDTLNASMGSTFA